MYNLTLKDKDAENVIFTATQGAAGNFPAVWTHQASTPILSEQISMSARLNASKTARKVRVTLSVPGMNELCADSCEIHNIPVSVELTFPNVLPFTARENAVAYLSSLLADASFKESIVSAYAPA